jgi:hypothetical protein
MNFDYLQRFGHGDVTLSLDIFLDSSWNGDNFRLLLDDPLCVGEREKKEYNNYFFTSHFIIA